MTVTQEQQTVQLIDSTPLLEHPDELAARADELGYLFFRGLLQRSDVLDVRHQIMEVVAAHGWLLAGTEVTEGRADVDAFDRVPATEAAFCGSGVPIDAYRDVQRLRAFHALGHSRELHDVFTGLLGGTVMRLPISIARVMVPSHGARPTPAHQDFIHVQGSADTWTAWFPLGDCPIELGGLTVLVGSHRDGLLTYHAAAGAGELEAYICDSGLRWGVADFEAGDVLTFSAHTVHRSQPNQRNELVRLSCDFRYQRIDQPIATNSLKVHCDVLPWDETYASWDTDAATDDLRYYWREHELLVTEWDESLRWQKHRIC